MHSTQRHILTLVVAVIAIIAGAFLPAEGQLKALNDYFTIFATFVILYALVGLGSSLHSSRRKRVTAPGDESQATGA